MATTTHISRIFTGITVAVLVNLMACQRIDPAIRDCQILLGRIQQTIEQAQALVASESGANVSQSYNFELWLQAADTLNEGAEAIAMLSLRDQQLQDYQRQLSDILQQQAAATYAMVKARQEKNIDAAEAIQAKSLSIGADEASLGEALDEYCQGKYGIITAPLSE